MKSDKVYLQHVLEMIGRIEAATKSGKKDFLSSQLESFFLNIKPPIDHSNKESTTNKIAQSD